LLARLRELLATGPVALWGIGGVGKTRLAVEYAHHFARDYELVWWFDAEVPDLLGEQCASLASHAGATGAGAAVSVAGEAARRHLRVGCSKPWLLIFDNATDPERLRGWLPDGRGHILVTSRC